ncbi:hypothetical protein ACFL0Q_06940 [Thermodesulfobacteriota bacterium]
MELKQRKYSNATTFNFENDTLKYTTKNQGSSSTYKLFYGEIPLERNELEERNPWFRNVGIFLVCLGILQLYSLFTGDEGFKLPIWLILGAVCFIVYWIGRTSYTTLPAKYGNVFVIKDRYHDEILDELYKRRKDQLLLWYGDINFENEPESEIEKFRWLHEQEVIDEAEFENKKNAILDPNRIQETIN